MVEEILNTAINSSQFDSAYTQKRVYFLANDLLFVNSPLVLKRNKLRAKVLNERQVKRVKQYVILGDFTLDWNNPNPSGVRVQFSISPNITLGMRLVKNESGIWIIKHHIIFRD